LLPFCPLLAAQFSSSSDSKQHPLFASSHLILPDLQMSIPKQCSGNTDVLLMHCAIYATSLRRRFISSIKSGPKSIYLPKKMTEHATSLCSNLLDAGETFQNERSSAC
jgi:hypothetical protein